VTIPAAWRSNPDAAEQWVTRSFTTVAALPPKKKKG
jgi:hypothetical protein